MYMLESHCPVQTKHCQPRWDGILILKVTLDLPFLTWDGINVGVPCLDLRTSSGHSLFHSTMRKGKEFHFSIHYLDILEIEALYLHLMDYDREHLVEDISSIISNIKKEIQQ